MNTSKTLQIEKTCPVCGDVHPLLTMIHHLMAFHLWTRTQVIMWFEVMGF